MDACLLNAALEVIEYDQVMSLDLNHLEIRLRAYDFYHKPCPLSEEKLKLFLINKLKSIDLNLAKEDIIKFVKDPHSIDAWSTDLFIAAINAITFIPTQ